jgi:uncharacterized protein YidB (DUF937 family)
MAKFSQGGLGDIFSSWVGLGENKSISPDQINSLLGSDQIGSIAKGLGIDPALASGFLADHLPKIIDKLTPSGQVEAGADDAKGLASLLPSLLASLGGGDSGKAWDEAVAGLSLRSSNPRLLLLAAESAAQLGLAAPSPEEKREWHSRASAYFDEAIRERPFFSYSWRERALALDYQARFSEALPVHLRAIARDPDHARGYEYLAYHYWLQGRKQEARRLLYLAQTLTGSFLAADLLRLLEADRDSL